MTFLRCYKGFTIPLTPRLPSKVPVADELYVQNLQLELSLLMFSSCVIFISNAGTLEQLLTKVGPWVRLPLRRTIKDLMACKYTQV